MPSEDLAMVRNFLPGTLTAWWWKELTNIFSCLYILNKVESFTICTLWVGSSRSASCECFTSWWISCSIFPPKAIAKVWMPRQMPSIGIWRLYAKRTSKNSARSRSRLMLCRRGEGSSPIQRGLWSPPPERISPSRCWSVLMMTSVSATGGMMTGVPPAAITCL